MGSALNKPISRLVCLSRTKSDRSCTYFDHSRKFYKSNKKNAIIYSAKTNGGDIFYNIILPLNSAKKRRILQT